MQHAQERLHQVDLRIRPRSRGPPLVPRIIVVPLELDLAVLDDEGERLYDLFGLGVSFGEFGRGERVEREEGVEDAVEREVMRFSRGQYR